MEFDLHGCVKIAKVVKPFFYFQETILKIHKLHD